MSGPSPGTFPYSAAMRAGTEARVVEQLKVYVHPNGATLGRAAADAAAETLRRAVSARGVAHAMFATGNSQLEFIDALVHDTPGVPWSDIVVFHMDEYVGVGPDHQAGFQRWIRERIVNQAKPRDAHYIDGLADPGTECDRYAGLLADHPLDLCCLRRRRSAGGRDRHHPGAVARLERPRHRARAPQGRARACLSPGPGVDGVSCFVLAHPVSGRPPSRLRFGERPRLGVIRGK